MDDATREALDAAIAAAASTVADAKIMEALTEITRIFGELERTVATFGTALRKYQEGGDW